MGRVIPMNSAFLANPSRIIQMYSLQGKRNKDYVGLSANEEELVFSSSLESDSFREHVVRLQERTRSLLTHNILPAAGLRPKDSEDCYLPEIPEHCKVTNVRKCFEKIIRKTKGLYALDFDFRLNEEARQRLADTENGLMVIGCGPSLYKHRSLHPHAITFSIDFDSEMSADFTAYFELALHRLPDKNHFSLIVIEHIGIEGCVTNNRDEIIFKKCHQLLKPGGIFLMMTGLISRDYEPKDVRHKLMASLITAGFNNTKVVEDANPARDTLMGITKSSLSNPDQLRKDLEVEFQKLKTIDHYEEYMKGTILFKQGLNLVALKEIQLLQRALPEKA